MRGAASVMMAILSQSCDERRERLDQLTSAAWQMPVSDDA
jgi:hypothetical protein